MKRKIISLCVIVSLLLANLPSSAIAEVLQYSSSRLNEASVSGQKEIYDPFSSDFFANPQINSNAKNYTYTDIVLNISYTVNVNTGGEGRYFRFIPTSNGFYTFESSVSSSVNPVAALYNGNIQSISSHDNTGSSYNFRLTYYFAANVTYYFAAGSHPNTSADSYSVSLKYTTSHTYIPAKGIMSGGSQMSLPYAYSAEFFEITPTATGTYIFYSSASSGNPGMLLFNSNLSMIGGDDNSGGNNNFRCRASLTANQTYYLAVGHSGASSGNYTFNVYKPADIATDVYYIKNIGSTMIVDIHGPAEETYVHQWTFSTAPQKKWKIQKQSDGYYTIRSEYGNKKYVGISNTNTGQNNIQLYSSIADNTKWNIYYGYHGDMILEPKTAAWKALVAQDDVRGTELRLENTVADVGNRNLWHLADGDAIKILDYVNYYDSTFATNTTLRNNIVTANEFADYCFSKYFNVSMHMSGAASQYATIADDCPTGTNAPCDSTTCGSHYGHHKNIIPISDQIFYDQRKDDHIYVLWTNREKGTYCEFGGFRFKGLAVVNDNRPVIHVATIYGDTDEQKFACMMQNIVHETAHTLNMAESYDAPFHNTQDDAMCIMEAFDESTAYNFYESVRFYNFPPFCDYCMEDMQELTSNILITGN